MSFEGDLIMGPPVACFMLEPCWVSLAGVTEAMIRIEITSMGKYLAGVA
jgi:hypothetical protein